MRRPYIDWLRGLAVLIMIEWHAVDAWTAAEARGSEAFRIAALVGGWAAPLFLFLAGVAVPLAGASNDAKGAAWIAGRPPGPSRCAAGRCSPSRTSSGFSRFSSICRRRWSSLFKPDILNILGLGLVAAAFCWGRATTPRRAVFFLVIPAAIIVLARAVVARVVLAGASPSETRGVHPSGREPRRLHTFSVDCVCFHRRVRRAPHFGASTAPRTSGAFHLKLALAGLGACRCRTGSGSYLPPPLRPIRVLDDVAVVLPDPSRRHDVRPCRRVAVDAASDQRPLESAGRLRADVAVRLLGPRRAGVRRLQCAAPSRTCRSAGRSSRSEC